jgi:hypothetical protein
MIGKTTWHEVYTEQGYQAHLVELLVRPALMSQPACYGYGCAQNKTIRQLLSALDSASKLTPSTAPHTRRRKIALALPLPI